ncbi:MAG: MraY family glycosyltransferase [Pseudomonadota bacterium]
MLVPFVFMPVAAFAVASGLLWLLTRPGLARWVLDRPNERSLHAAPVPRTGGVAIMAGVAAAASVAVSVGTPFRDDVAVALFLAFALAILSFVDDMRGLDIRLRLFAHMAAAAALLSQSAQGMAIPALLAFPLLVWMTNLYNFMDGADGLAGGMALFGFGAYAAAAGVAGDAALAAVSASCAVAAAAFLLFNFHPARIFMGDAGSIPLGFLAGALGWLGWQHGLWDAWFPVVVFSPFIADATITLLYRLVRGERVWQAHREHLYQRLVRLGWGHRGTALAEYALMGVCAAAALLFREAQAQYITAMLVALTLAYALLVTLVVRAWRARFGKGVA